jgi:hypothetical protein
MPFASILACRNPEDARGGSALLVTEISGLSPRQQRQLVRIRPIRGGRTQADHSGLERRASCWVSLSWRCAGRFGGSASRHGRGRALAWGFWASLGLLIAAELALVIALRGMALQEYFATRDPVTGTLYYLILGVFAFMPLIVARK